MAKNARKARVLEESVTPETPEVEQVEQVAVPLDDKGRKTTVNWSMEQIDEKGWKTKSAIIRGLDAEGYSRSAIAKFLGIKYQFVRNVLVTPMKRVSQA